MSDLEQKILSSWGGTRPLLFKRFIDDIFFVWPGTEEELKEFIALMNSAHTHIKFISTYDVQSKSIPFLDMYVGYTQRREIYQKFISLISGSRYLRRRDFENLLWLLGGISLRYLKISMISASAIS